MSNKTQQSTLVARLWAKVQRRADDDCWLWLAALSRGSRREGYYGSIYGRAGKIWRVNRLILILWDGPIDVPRESGESFDEWLDRANAFYEFLDAAHTCDNSICCNPLHLKWEDHVANIKNQYARRTERSLIDQNRRNRKRAIHVPDSLPATRPPQNLSVTEA